ncbi:39S ribosomal protein L32, mitochondrial-like [Mercenaria mercenaria]|uniref:39S ribosomal protein L32, mitochondrial-like n=1 Tax=Mercenaria mercenaria TaxID=6596 RepID=UPI00234F4BAC|nr:39S ribosomal protein L32, mitochondrial-like [Mercenaria mercenaria]
MAAKMTFVTKIRHFIQNLTHTIENIATRHTQTGLPAVCYNGPSTDPQPGRSSESILADLFEPILYAVPRNRRSLERRRMRKFSLPDMETARVKKNIIICLNCGHPHERQTICGNCYSKVREETKKMREAMDEDKYYYDHPRQEVTYLYKGEEDVKDIPMYKGRYLVEVDRERPSWFSKDLLKKVKGET